jgi:hypothetical protein
MDTTPLRFGFRLRALVAALLWGFMEAFALMRSAQLRRRL